MNDQPNLRQFVDQISSFSEDEARAAPAAKPAQTLSAIGKVVEIAGSGSQVRLDGPTLTAIQGNSDPSVAMSGQVGSQVKMIVGANWLIANVRTMREGDNGEIIAQIDFLG